MTRRYYAVQWPYGRVAWSSEHGTPSTAISFESKAARDQWVNEGDPYTTQPGNREAVTAAQVSKYHLGVVTVKTWAQEH